MYTFRAKFKALLFQVSVSFSKEKSPELLRFLLPNVEMCAKSF